MKRKKMNGYRYIILMMAVWFVMMGCLPMAVKAEEETWIVVFDARGGNCDVSEVRVPKGDSITLPEIDREGYRFDGWMYMYDKEDGTVKVENQGLAGEIFTPREIYTSLYAGWYEEFSLTFDACGGECAQGNMLVIEIESVILPDAVREGFEFTGWYGNEELTEYIGSAGDDYSAREDKVLYAGWKEVEKEKQKFTVTFEAGEGECNPKIVEVEEGESVTLPEATREGYEFTGWYEDEELTKYIGTAGDPFAPREGKKLYAGWKEEEKEKQKFTITFEAGEGECNPKIVEVEEGESVTLPEATREGYEFTGWYEDEGLTKYIGAAGDPFIPKKGEALYAGWKVKETAGGGEKEPEQDKEQKVTVTFHTGGGSKVEPVQVVKGNMVKLPSTAREGAVLIGWYTEKEGGILLGMPGDGLKVTEDLTAYALWEKKEEDKGDKDKEETEDKTGDQTEGNRETCSTVFNTGEGSLAVTEVTVVKGAGLYLPLPEREGYEFLGWYLDEELTRFAGNGGEVYQVTENTCFYAKWKKTEESSGAKETVGDDTGRGDRRKPEADQRNSGTGKQKTDGNAGDAGTDTLSAGKIDSSGETADGVFSDTGKAVEPVIQTGHLSPVPVFYGTGLCTILLFLSALSAGRKGRKKEE